MYHYCEHRGDHEGGQRGGRGVAVLGAGAGVQLQLRLGLLPHGAEHDASVPVSTASCVPVSGHADLDGVILGGGAGLHAAAGRRHRAERARKHVIYLHPSHTAYSHLIFLKTVCVHLTMC